MEEGERQIDEDVGGKDLGYEEGYYLGEGGHF